VLVDSLIVAEAALEGGAPTLQVRIKTGTDADRLHLSEAIAARCRAAGATCLVNDRADVALAVGADGVHLAGGDPWPDDPAAGLRVGRSCHTPGELVTAATRGTADYATFSPVFATASKPGYGPGLGIDGLAAGCLAVAGVGSRLAVYALGGIGPGQAAACVAAGATGIAVMGIVMRADDPGAVVTSLRDAMADAGSGALARRADA